MQTFLGLDVGTASTKGVLVDQTGTVLASTAREHQVARPAPGQVEMDANIWWAEFVAIANELLTGQPAPTAIGVSGMGPCALLTDNNNTPLAPAALYGVDTRAIEQIKDLNNELGADAIYQTADSPLTTQAAGPKLRWFAQHNPSAYQKAKRLHMPASYLVANLTGEYVLDRQSASQATPLYDAKTQQWHQDWAAKVAPGLELPRLAWAGDIAGTITPQAAAQIPGLAVGTPVTVGTIDAWAEAESVGALQPGDLMLMYGTTMFLIATTDHRVKHPNMWGTTCIRPGQWNLAGGMATSGAITGWLRGLFGNASYADLIIEAQESGPGANGLLMLPYFEGERTPIADPLARGTITGLTIGHTRGDLYRAALEATAYGVRHNIEALHDAGVDIRRVIGVGGGTKSTLWPQIVADITGLPQEIRSTSVGASYGDAYLAANAVGLDVDIEQWNPTAITIVPHPNLIYEERYQLYRELYDKTADIQHALAKSQLAANLNIIGADQDVA